MKKRITIKDVAKTAGVSHPTVSRVIHDHPRISEETKRHVRMVMARLGYQPDLVARGLIRSKARVLAALIPDLNPHVQPILRGIVDACTRNEYALMLFSRDYWTEAEVSYAHVAENWRVNGVVIYNVVYHEKIQEEVEDWELPCVFVNKYLREKTVATVGCDNYDAVMQVITHFVELGRKRIGILNGGMRSVDGVERFLGFKEALAKHGVPFDESLTGCANFSDTEAYEEMKRILYSAKPPSAMFCANDLMAMGAIKALRERGLRVPEDVAVVGFDDLESDQYFQPSLSSLRPPLREIGERSIEMLIARMENAGSPPEQMGMKAKLVIRGSSSTSG